MGLQEGGIALRVTGFPQETEPVFSVEPLTSFGNREDNGMKYLLI